MIRRIVPALVLGLGGAAFLIALGLWQVQRLQWKSDILSQIETRIAAAPGPLPERPDSERDRYRPVALRGMVAPGALHVLTSFQSLGAGYRVIAPFESVDGRRILLDRGFIRQEAKAEPLLLPEGPVDLVGNLHWPNERDSFTPEPDLADNIWFARDVPAMAEALDTEPLLVVAREATGPGVTPIPVGTAGIPNNHLHYAITWFGLAVVWLGMTGLWLWRITRREA